MRRLLPALAAAALVCGVSACSGSDDPSVTPGVAESSAATESNAASPAEDPTTEETAAAQETSAAASENAEAASAETPEQTTQDTDASESAAAPAEGATDQAEAKEGEPVEEPERCIGTLSWQPSENPDPEGYNWTLMLENGDAATFTLNTNRLPEETLFEETSFGIDPAAAQEVCKAYSSLPSNASGEGAWITYALEPQITGETIEDGGSSQAKDLAVKVIGEERFNKAMDAYEKHKKDN